MNFRYCPLCATELQSMRRSGRNRAICPACGYVHYRNPTVGVAVVLLSDGQILLGRRAQDQSYAGRWCIPCGHVEWDEDLRHAAVREFAEETGLQVSLGEVVAVHSNFHNPVQHTVGIWFMGSVEGGDLRAQDDLDAVAYYPVNQPPDLAFPTDKLVLKQLAATNTPTVEPS